jgi:hypothetical protein
MFLDAKCAAPVLHAAQKSLRQRFLERDVHFDRRSTASGELSLRSGRLVQAL